MAEDIVRVLRLLEYVGPRRQVEATMQHNEVKSERNFGGMVVRSAILGTFPEVMQRAEDKTKKFVLEELERAKNFFPDNDSMREGYIFALQTIRDNGWGQS